MLHRIGLEEKEAFRVAINNIKKHCFLSLDMLAVSEEIEAKRPKPVRTVWPKEHIGRPDDEWHQAFYSRILPPKARPPYEPPIGSLYNGLMIRFHKEGAIFYIHNNETHVFPSWKTFVEMGNSLGEGLYFDLSFLLA